MYSRQCRDLVYDQIRRALDMVGLIVYDSGSTTPTSNPTLTLLLTKDEINFVKSLRQFEVREKPRETFRKYSSLSFQYACRDVECFSDIIYKRTTGTIMQ